MSIFSILKPSCRSLIIISCITFTQYCTYVPKAIVRKCSLKSADNNKLRVICLWYHFELLIYTVPVLNNLQNTSWYLYQLFSVSKCLKNEKLRFKTTHCKLLSTSVFHYATYEIHTEIRSIHKIPSLFHELLQS